MVVLLGKAILVTAAVCPCITLDVSVRRITSVNVGTFFRQGKFD